jgi:ammonium transporter
MVRADETPGPVLSKEDPVLNRCFLVVAALFLFIVIPAVVRADDKPDPDSPVVYKQLEAAKADVKVNGDVAWMSVSAAFVMFMVPGLALFYGGLVRRKNVLATMMHSMASLAVVGVWWFAVGYSLAFGPSQGGVIGWSPRLLFLVGVQPTDMLPGTNIPIYLHALYQGMFAIITPALISGAVAERIRFWPYCLFLVLWVTFVYCPLAHMVWAMNWWDADPATAGTIPVGLLGGQVGALDFAGGTVVHIAAGVAGLAAILVLRKRIGYPEHAMHPNSVVLALLGAGLLWFGWFGFNGGSALGSGTLSVSAFGATQAAAAAAGLTWMVIESLHKGKPTAVGLATGIVAGLVAVTPASGFVYAWGGLIIGVAAALVCYGSVLLKGVFKYDDSLDAFGVHGVGGFVGAVLTGVFCYAAVNSAGKDGLLAGNVGQFVAQCIAAVASTVFAFVGSIVLVKLVDATVGFTTDARSETEGLDRTEHGEVGFDYGPAMEMSPEAAKEPRPASLPPGARTRYTVVVDGPHNGELMKAWSRLCQAGPQAPSPDFLAVYPHVTTVQDNSFRCRGGSPGDVAKSMQRLFEDALKGTPVRAHVEHEG